MYWAIRVYTSISLSLYDYRRNCCFFCCNLSFYRCMINHINLLWNNHFFPVGVAPEQLVMSIPASSFGADELGETMEDYDVLVCGGTLGIFIAAALCHKGLRVGIIEKNLLQGVWMIFFSLYFEVLTFFCYFFVFDISC